LATFIRESVGAFRLIVSPFLRPEDRAAIEAGLGDREGVLDEAFSKMLITEDLIQRHTLKCISHLLRTGRIDIRVALMRDGLFHPKVWLFSAADRILAAHGS